MPMEVDRRQFLQLAGANAAAFALGPIGAAAPGRSEKVGQTQTDIELFDVQCGFGGMTPGDPKVVSVEELVTEMAWFTRPQRTMRTMRPPRTRRSKRPANGTLC